MKKIEKIMTIIAISSLCFCSITFTLSRFIKVIEGKSMQPTYEGNGKEIAISKKQSTYNKGDVVVIQKSITTFLIKRVIATPGETISIEDGTIYVNDKPSEYQKEKIYVNSKYISEDMPPVTLSDNEYFCVGDNINDSIDSRYYGPFNAKKMRLVTKVIDLNKNKKEKHEYEYTKF